MRKNIKNIMAIMVAATLFTVNNATVKANIDENNATSNDAAVKKVIDSIKSNDSSEINLYDGNDFESVSEKLEKWSAESLLPAIDILSLAKPENHGNAAAVVEYKITGLPSNVAIQNFAVGSTYIYITQHAGNNTLLSRCTITGTKSSDDNSIIAECKNGDYMTLEDFGHGESLAMATYNNTTYFYVGAEVNKTTDTSYQWSKQIARIKYASKTTLNNRNASKIRYLNYANTNLTSVGTVNRVACAASSSQFIIRTQVTSGKVQYSIYELSAINKAFDEADGRTDKTVSFKGNTTLKKACTKSFVQSSNANNLVYPNGSFQGMDLTNGGNIYLAGGGYNDAFNRVAKMSSSGKYIFRWNITEIGQKNNEIEGIKSKNTKIFFAMKSESTKNDKRIFSATVK